MRIYDISLSMIYIHCALCYHAHYTYYARKKIRVTVNGTSLPVTKVKTYDESIEFEFYYVFYYIYRTYLNNKDNLYFHNHKIACLQEYFFYKL